MLMNAYVLFYSAEIFVRENRPFYRENCPFFFLYENKSLGITVCCRLRISSKSNQEVAWICIAWALWLLLNNSTLIDLAIN